MAMLVCFIVSWQEIASVLKLGWVENCHVSIIIPGASKLYGVT